MSIYTAAWLAWLAFFAVVEGRALTNKRKDDTLSEHVWRWFAVKDKSKKGIIRLRRFALLALMAWLVAHFLTGGFF